MRELAVGLGVSPATVAAAYRQLQVRGLLVSDRRRGTRVRSNVALQTPPPVPRTAPDRQLVDLATGNPDPELLPPLEQSFLLPPALRHGYDDPPELRELVAFARAEFSADGVAADALAVTNGALDAIERVLREHLRHGDRVLVEDPVVPAIHDLVIASGFTPDPVAVDAEGPRPDALAEALRRRPQALIFMPRAQNPTGASVSRARADELRRLLKAHGHVLVIENDPFAPLAGVPAVTLTEGRTAWAVVRSTSKFLGPDLRVALVAGDETTINRLRARQAVGPRWVSHLLQHVVLSLWSDPSCGRRLARAADVYAHRRARLVQALAAHDVAISAPAGFNLWIPVRHEAATVQQLAERGWTVAPGERFRMRAGPGIRVTTSALAPEQATRFAADLAVLLQLGTPPAA